MERHTAADLVSVRSSAAAVPQDGRVYIPRSADPIWVRIHRSRFPERKLRISVTDHCNLSCFFCHNEGQGPIRRLAGSVLTADEIVTATRIALDASATTVTLTGGEPLLFRSGHDSIVDLVDRITELRSPEREFALSLTTNGVLLPEFATPLKAAGVDGMTISLTTLQPRTFERLIGSRRSLLARSLHGLRTASTLSFDPLTINSALYYSEPSGLGNVDELAALARLAIERRVTELKLYTLLWHAGFEKFGEFYQFFSPRVQAMLTELFTAVGMHSPVETVRRLVSLGHDLADLAEPKVEFGVDLGGTSLAFEAMKYGRFAVDSGGQEGPYAMRLSADGALRTSLTGPPNYDFIIAIRAGQSTSGLLHIYRAAQKEIA